MVNLQIHFAGKVFFFNSTGSIPGFAFILIPLFLLIVEMVYKKKNFPILFIAIYSLAVGFFQININIPLQPRNENLSKTIKIFNWNTNCWDQNKNRDQFFSYLEKSEADILILQEYLHARNWQEQESATSQYFSIYSTNPFFPKNYEKVNDRKRLQLEFPGFDLAIVGQFVIISRFPILNSFLDRSEQYMVADLKINQSILRIFNVHLLLHIEPVNPFTPYFYMALQNRFQARQVAIENLKCAIEKTEYEYIISGDFNSTKSMRVIQPFLKNHINAFTYSDEWFSVTFQFHGFPLWCFDYILIPNNNPNLNLAICNNLDFTELSDHKAQEVFLLFNTGDVYAGP